MAHRLLDRLVVYLPPLVFLVLAPLANFFPALLDDLGHEYILSLIGLAFLGIGFHLERRQARMLQLLHATRNEVDALREEQTAFLDRTRPAVGQSSLAGGFRLQAAEASHVRELRIFAISSQQILSFFRSEDFLIDHCMLLIRAFEENDTDHRDFLNQILLVVRDWQKLAMEGKIGRLTIHSYDFLPTEYQVIFDSRAMLLGLYDSDPDDYSEVAVRQPLYVDGRNPDGEAIIMGYKERFDRLFEVCGHHYGQNPYDDFSLTNVRARTTNLPLETDS